MLQNKHVGKGWLLSHILAAETHQACTFRQGCHFLFFHFRIVYRNFQIGECINFDLIIKYHITIPDPRSQSDKVTSASNEFAASLFFWTCGQQLLSYGLLEISLFPMLTLAVRASSAGARHGNKKGRVLQVILNYIANGMPL